MFAVTAAPQTVFTCTFEPKLNIATATEPANFGVQVSTDAGTTFNDYVAGTIAVKNNNTVEPPYNQNTITLSVAVANSPTTLVRVV